MPSAGKVYGPCRKTWRRDWTRFLPGSPSDTSTMPSVTSSANGPHPPSPPGGPGDMHSATRQRSSKRCHEAGPCSLRVVALLLFAATVPVHGQSPADADASVEPPPEAYAAITGLYQLEDGRRLSIFDVVDQLRDHQLVAVEPGSGRARTLYPVSHTVFEAGSGWFAPEPREYRLRFRTGTDGRIAGLVQEPLAESVGSDGVVGGRPVQLRAREVQFGDAEVGLSGTIVLPTSEGPHPGVVIVHGSGPLTRRVPRYMAELFAHRGVAALVYDKRGTGASTGEWRGASHEALADDATAAFRELRRQPEVDPDRVGLFGSSEGGYVVPVVASREQDVAFLVCRVCPALPQARVALDEQASALRRAGRSDEEIADALAFHRLLIRYTVDREGRDALEAAFDRWRDAPWMERYGFRAIPPSDASYWSGFRAVLTVDPREHLRRFDAPVLIVLGERDERIPVEKHAPEFEAAGRAAGNDDFTVEVMSDATHGLLVAREGPGGEGLAPDRFAPRFHDLVVEWVAERFLDSEP